MQISTKSLGMLVLVVLAAACGSANDPAGMPASNGAGVMQGSGMGSGSQNMRVQVPSSSAATTIDATGGFLLTHVPKGAPALQLSGGGPKANLPTGPAGPGGCPQPTLRTSGANVTKQNE